MKLDDAATALAIDVAFWIEGVADPDYSVVDLGKCVYELCPKLRALGIILLLTEGNTEAFLHNLIRSGRAWRTYLVRAAAEQPDEHHYCSGRYFALLDAIAAGEFGLASEIFLASPAELRNGHEYEDDWCYGRILQWLLNTEFDAPTLVSLLERMEAYLESTFHPAIDLTRSFVDREQSDFDAAFQRLLDHRQMEIADKIKFGQLLDPIVEANRRVNVEALAWLRLAELHGFTTQPEYELCPSLARLPRETPLPEDSDPQMSDWLR